MKIYTRTGDKGSTSLFGGERVSKGSLRLRAYGGLDELNGVLGVVMTEKRLPKELKTQLTEIQSLLFGLGADLATPHTSKAGILRINGNFATTLEQWIDAMEADLPPLTQFILPGGSSASAHLHLARTVCRRAEREIVELAETEKISEGIIVIINRLSDYLFVAARYTNKKLKVKDQPVDIPRSAHT